MKNRMINITLAVGAGLAIIFALGYSLILFASGFKSPEESAQTVIDRSHIVVNLVATESVQEPPEADSEESEEVLWTDSDVELMAKLIFAEASEIDDKAQQAAVGWCVLNRLDAGYFGETIEEVITSPNQFACTDGIAATNSMKELANDILNRWYAEKQGVEDVGRTLPEEYLYFEGDGQTNYFHIEWKGEDDWDWSLPSPYENEENLQ